MNKKWLFSVINDDIHKVITIFGVKFKFKNNKLIQRKQIKQLEHKINKTNQQLKAQQKQIITLQEQITTQLELIQKETSDCIRTRDIPSITEISMIKTKYNWDNIFIPKIKNNKETIEALTNTNNSIIRFGDGEFSLMSDKFNMFEKPNEEIKEHLKNIFYEDNENLLIGAITPYYEYPLYLSEVSIMYIKDWMSKWHRSISKFYNPNKTYYSAYISQSYPVFKNYPFEEHYNSLKQIWDDKKITIICGDRVFNDIEYNIFENARTIDYIYGPTVGAFEKYEEIKQSVEQVSKENILIFALGPCGKVLAYEMFKQGYRVLDFGHLIKDYNFYKKSKSMTDEEWKHHRKVFFGRD